MENRQSWDGSVTYFWILNGGQKEKSYGFLKSSSKGGGSFSSHYEFGKRSAPFILKSYMFNPRSRNLPHVSTISGDYFEPSETKKKSFKTWISMNFVITFLQKLIIFVKTSISFCLHFNVTQLYCTFYSSTIWFYSL